MARHMPTVAKIQPPISAMTATTTTLLCLLRDRAAVSSVAHSPDRGRKITVMLASWADVQIDSHVMGQDDTVQYTERWNNR